MPDKSQSTYAPDIISTLLCDLPWFSQPPIKHIPLWTLVERSKLLKVGIACELWDLPEQNRKSWAEHSLLDPEPQFNPHKSASCPAAFLMLPPFPIWILQWPMAGHTASAFSCGARDVPLATLFGRSSTLLQVWHWCAHLPNLYSIVELSHMYSLRSHTPYCGVATLFCCHISFCCVHTQLA